MRIMLLVEGINNDPQSWNDWPNRVAPMVNERSGESADWKAQGLLYGTDALTVGVSEAERVQTFADMLKSYAGAEIHAWAHSNGTRVVASALPLAPQVKIKTLHLLCGALDADFESNGLNAALRSGQVEHIYAYIATEDSAMRVENTVPGDLLFGIPLGHKPLGLAGPTNVDPNFIARVHVIDWTGYDHSTCWDDAHFDGTVDQVMTLAEAAAPRRSLASAGSPEVSSE